MRLSVSTFVVALSLVVTAAAAHSETISFGPATIPTGTAFTTYTQNGYTVTQGAGQFIENQFQGNPPEGLSGGTAIASASHGTNSLVLTDGGAQFSLLSFDLNDYGNTPVTYEIVGSNGGTQAFDTGALLDTHVVTGWFTLADPFAGISVDKITLTISDNSANSLYAVDNLVAATPEPESLLLVATGLLGAAAAARRRLAL